MSNFENVKRQCSTEFCFLFCNIFWLLRVVINFFFLPTFQVNFSLYHILSFWVAFYVVNKVFWNWKLHISHTWISIEMFEKLNDMLNISSVLFLLFICYKPCWSFSQKTSCRDKSSRIEGGIKTHDNSLKYKILRIVKTVQTGNV